VAVDVLATVARRIGVPYPILLVLGGLVLGFVPGLPRITLNPDIVFLVFVPPLVYSAAYFTSWRDFVANRRPILLLAIGLVLATMVIVAAAAEGALPGFTWPAAFVLGAVVSDTDTTAAVAIAERLRIPRQVVTILEGESLINDAVGLTAFRLAVVATVTGVFSPWSVGADFALATVGALAIGLAVGWLTTWGSAHLDDRLVAITAGLLAPYAAYLPADRLGASGILAVVVAGLYYGHRAPRVNPPDTRLQARAVWDLLIFVENGLLFILVGLELRPIWDALAVRSATRVLGDAALVCAVVILARVVWVFASVALARRGRHAAVDAPAPNWRSGAIVAWAGMRGGDTLAAALGVPLLTDRGLPFPARSLIVFLAFAVIFVTLVGQGLTLPPLIRWLGVRGGEAEAAEEVLARRAATGAALARLDALATAGEVPPGMLASLRKFYRHKATLLPGERAGADEAAAQHVALHQRVQRAIVQAERQAVLGLRDEGAIGDDVLHRIERELDLEEVRDEI